MLVRKGLDILVVESFFYGQAQRSIARRVRRGGKIQCRLARVWRGSSPNRVS